MALGTKSAEVVVVTRATRAARALAVKARPQPLCFTVPVPPSLNNAYAAVRGRRVLSLAGRVFKEIAGWHAQVAAKEQGWQPCERYALTLRLFFPTARRRDLDNCIKLTLDAIAEALHFDDSHIDRLVVERAGVDKERPRCDVTLEVQS